MHSTSEEKNWDIFFDFAIFFIGDQVDQHKNHREQMEMENAWNEIKDRFNKEKESIIGKIIESKFSIEKVGLYGHELKFKIDLIKKFKKSLEKNKTDELVDIIFNFLNIILGSILAALGAGMVLVLEGLREFKECLHIFIKHKKIEYVEKDEPV